MIFTSIDVYNTVQQNGQVLHTKTTKFLKIDPIFKYFELKCLVF
jgi:hypothetical protein